MSEEENIKRPQPTDDPQGAEGGQQPEEDAVNSITEDKSLLTDNIAGDAEQQSEIKNLKSKLWKYIIMPTTRQHLITKKTGNHISGNF
jgi:hypothetical protein